MLLGRDKMLRAGGTEADASRLDETFIASFHVQNA